MEDGGSAKRGLAAKSQPAAAAAGRMVDHERGGVEEIFVEGGDGFWREVGFGHGLFHQFDPAVAGAFIDGEGGVAHAEAGVAALVAVGGGAAEALDQEEAEAFFGVGEIVLGIKGAEDVVGAERR